MPANSFWGGLIESIGPAMQASQESGLKQQMMKMQMMEYEARQKKANAEAELAGQHQLLTQKWQAAQTPEEKQGIMQQGALLNQDYKTLAALSAGPAKSMVQQMEEYDAYLARKGQGSGGMGGGGGGASPYGQRTGFNPTFNSDGSSKMVGYTNQPSGKQAEIEGLLHSVGVDPNNKNAQIKAFSVVSAPPEVQSMLLSQFQQEFGGRQSQPQQQQFSVPQRYPQQPGQAPQQPQQEAGIEAVGPDGKPIMFDNQATYDEYTQRGLPLGPQGGAQQPTPQYAGGGGGGSPYDVIRQKETAAAIERAGGSAEAVQARTPVSKAEGDALTTVSGYIDILSDLQDTWTPSASGPIQGRAAVGAVREAIPTSMGGHTDAETAAITKLNIAVGMFQSEVGGQTFTTAELANIRRQMPKPGMGDQQFKTRLNTVLEILQSKRDKMENLTTQPRSEIRESLGGAPKRRAGAGGAGGLTPKAQDYLERITGGQ